jgi:hypothetical protein
LKVIELNQSTLIYEEEQTLVPLAADPSLHGGSKNSPLSQSNRLRPQAVLAASQSDLQGLMTAGLEREQHSATEETQRALE